MGHKVNPDIFRLGVSKTWTFQFKTNKNFIKNLFLFKFLRNLFMNYTIPFFDFKKRRNQKINDKLILRGEDQLIASPFVKNNLLFSHVYFGLVKNRVFIESFFIDVSFKQPRKKNENVRRSPFLDITEYKPWNSLFYKTSVLNQFSRRKLKTKNKLRKVFGNRVFKFLGKRSKVFKFKSVKRLSKDFYFFLRNFNPKYNKSLCSVLRTNYKVLIKRSRYKKRRRNKPRYFFVRIFRKNKRRKKNFLFTKSYYDYFLNKTIKRNKLDDRFLKFQKKYSYFKNLFFIKKKKDLFAE